MGLNRPYVDYQIARLFEDLQVPLPSILEPVPSDLVAAISDPSWYERAQLWAELGENGDNRWERWYEATKWWHERSFDTAYMSHGPVFQLWRAGDLISIRWTDSSKGVWTLPKGEFSLSSTQFEAAVDAFFQDVMSAMSERVSSIRRDGWHREDCKLDIPMLLKNHDEHLAALEHLKSRRSETDWDQARTLLNQLRAEVG